MLLAVANVLTLLRDPGAHSLSEPVVLSQFRELVFDAGYVWARVDIPLVQSSRLSPSSGPFLTDEDRQLKQVSDAGLDVEEQLRKFCHGWFDILRLCCLSAKAQIV